MDFIQKCQKKATNNFLRAGLAMVAAAGFAIAMTPSHHITDEGQKLDLETMIPKQFADWTFDSSIIPIAPDPQRQAEINKIYSQTLSRTYFNGSRQSVMLSIAYGGDQSKALQAHKPEVCYESQGFQIGQMTKAIVDTTIGQIPVMHLVAKQGSRNEPITYWIRVGDSITRGWFEQNLARLSYGLTGSVADGILVRVSTISNDEPDSYRIQQTFLTAMLQGVKREDRFRLVGKLADRP
jgi:EpsI family protein